MIGELAGNIIGCALVFGPMIAAGIIDDLHTRRHPPVIDGKGRQLRVRQRQALKKGRTTR